MSGGDHLTWRNEMYENPKLYEINRRGLYRGEIIHVLGILEKRAYIVRKSGDNLEGFFPVLLHKERSHHYGEIPLDDPDFEWLTPENHPAINIGKWAMYKGIKVMVHYKWKEEYYAVDTEEFIRDGFFPLYTSLDKGEARGKVAVDDPDLIFLDDKDDKQEE